MDIFEKYEKKHNFLICADSDGCVMDVMDIKHERCFGPCFVKEFGLTAQFDKAMEVWLKINLYSKTRGFNRFKTCLYALKELNVCVEGLESFDDFCTNSPELSNRALEALINQNPNECLKKVLTWSIATNKAIEALYDEVETLPFENAKEALVKASEVCDVAAVSSANRAAVEGEWTHHGLDKFVNTLLSQEAGSKAHCIAKLLEKGYSPKNVIMAGDALSDIDAAKANGVWFYPIVIGNEKESWARLRDEVIPLLTNGQLTEQIQQNWIDEFYKSLNIQ